MAALYNLRSSTFYFDAPFTQGAKATLRSNLPQGMGIKNIRWVGADTAGDAVVILDADGNIFWKSTCPGADHVESDNVEREWDGDFTVPQLDSGELFITICRTGRVS